MGQLSFCINEVYDMVAKGCEHTLVPHYSFDPINVRGDD